MTATCPRYALAALATFCEIPIKCLLDLLTIILGLAEFLLGLATHNVPALWLAESIKQKTQPEMALELPSGAEFGYNRHCKMSPVDLEGSRGPILVFWGGF